MREPRVYLLHRCQNGQPWCRVFWRHRYGREVGRWLFRPRRPPYPWQWGMPGQNTTRLGELLLLHVWGSAMLSLALGGAFGAEVLAVLPYTSCTLGLPDIDRWLATRDKAWVDELMSPHHEVYSGWTAAQMDAGPLSPSVLIV